MDKKFKMVPAARVPGYSVIAVDFEAIEATGLPLKATGGWCAWRAEVREGKPKPAKPPCGIDGEHLSVNKPVEWLTFEEARAAFDGGGFEGVGLLMTSVPDDKGLTGLDMDKCLDAEGEVVEGKEELVEDFLRLGGYIEVSPSGLGLRQFLDCMRLEDFKQKTERWDLEVYDALDDRYLTMTGQPWPMGTPAGAVVDCQKALEVFIRKWCDPMPEPRPLEFDPEEWKGVDRSVEEVLALLRRNNRRGKITRLLAGDCSDYDGGHSEADMGLCVYTAFYSRNPKTIDAVVRQSGLMREKWDQRRGKETYGQRTIRGALKRQVQFYDADQIEKSGTKKSDTERKAEIEKRGKDNLRGGVADLMAPGGKSFKRDMYALSELLLRDARLQGVCFWDEFAGFVVFSRPLHEALKDSTAPKISGRMIDAHVLAFCRWFGREWNLEIKPEMVGAVLQIWAQHCAVNPVVDRLQELEKAWDGRPRVGEWLVRYCRAVTRTDEERDISGYVSAVGQKWLVSVVARAFQPGCQVDCMLVLEGKQGTRKSSAARVLAEVVGSEFFREGFRLGDGRESLISLRGRMIVEWAELSGMGKRDRNELKTFLTQQVDPYRQPYGRHEQDWPRTAVFIGNTNEGGYLSDPTGNRRFWPVTVGRIDIDALRLDAGQLLGEAVALYKAFMAGKGEYRWWFDDDDPRDQRTLAMATAEQARRVGGTFWGELASDLATKLVCGMLSFTDGGLVKEALPDHSFSVGQMRVWLSVGSEIGKSGGGGGGGGVEISDPKNLSYPIPSA